MKVTDNFYGSNPNYENRNKINTSEINQDAFNKINYAIKDLNKIKMGDYSVISNKVREGKMWQNIKRIASETGKTVENTWLGLNNGVKSFQQTLGKAINNTQADRMDFFNKQNEEILKNTLKEYNLI